MKPQPPYSDLNAAFQIHCHFLFQTRRNRAVFHGPVGERLVSLTEEIAQRRMYHILALDVKPDRLELLLSLRPFHSVSRTVQMLKGGISRPLFVEYPELEMQIGTRHLWGASYWVATSGVMTTAMIKSYVDSQRQHHSVTIQEPRVVSRYSAPDRESYLNFRKDSHAVYLLHYHFVFTVKGRLHAIDEPVARYLTDLILRVCQNRGYILLNLELVEEHGHMIVSARSKHAPQEIAESLMNNTSYLVLRAFPQLQPIFPDGQFWVPGFFVRSVGPKTTAQIKSYFHGVRDS